MQLGKKGMQRSLFAGQVASMLAIVPMFMYAT